MAHLTESLKAEKNLGLCEIPGSEANLYERLAHDPNLELIFQKAMEEISNQANFYLSQYVDFSKSQMIMDVGGGTGRNLVEIARHFPNTGGFVFDLPSICERAKSNFQKQGLGDRFTAIPGHCFNDKYPNNPDTILFCHFMTIWSPEENQKLIQNAYDALPSKGRLMVFNMISHNDGRGPLTAAMGAPYFITLATGRGMLYAPKDYYGWFKASGFRHCEAIPLPLDHRVFIAEK
jgi:SAM-dependent methyltransferase